MLCSSSSTPGKNPGAGGGGGDSLVKSTGMFVVSLRDVTFCM